MTDLSDEVRRRANGVCEYCHIPEVAFRRPFHIEHVIARQHGGATEAGNLALACWMSNLKKGPNLAGIDPQTGQVARLFNPRSDRWADHFSFGIGGAVARGIEIRGLTAIGRATTVVLGMNAEVRQMTRYQLWREGAKF